MLAPARLAPASLDPRPVKNPDSPGFPTSEARARAFAREIKAARARRMSWHDIALQMQISRIEAIRLAHSLGEVLARIRESESETRQQAS